MPDFYSGIKDSQNTFMSKGEAFRELENMGVAKAALEFSGGHDEGGVDRIKLFRADAPDAFKELREHVWPRVTDENGKTVYEELRGRSRRPKTRPLTSEEEAEMRLAQSLAAPIYDRYDSFAGEFSVYGTLTWDVVNRDVVMSGDQSVEMYEDIYEEF